MDHPIDPWFAPEPRTAWTLIKAFYQRWLPPLVFGGAFAWLLFVHFFKPSHPPIGSYIGTLAFLVAVVTIWPPENNWSKAAWLMAFFALTGLEISTLYQDRAENQEQQMQARKKEGDAFKLIADGLSSAITQSQNQFSATVSRVDRVSGLAEENLRNMTGGDSWGWVSILRYGGPGSSENIVGLTIQNEGKRYPLRGIRIVAIDTVHQIMHEASVPDVPANTGFNAPPEADLDLSTTSHNQFWIIIAATNGAVMEDLSVDHINGGGWSQKIEVYRALANGNRKVLKRLP